MRTALKEWASIADALGHGEQNLILRKGGINKSHGGFLAALNPATQLLGQSG